MVKKTAFMRRGLTALLALTMLAAAAPAGARAEEEDYSELYAEEEQAEEGELASEEDSEALADAEGDGDTEEPAAGNTSAVYREKTLEDFDAATSPAIYIGKISDVAGYYSIFAEKGNNFIK